MTQYTLLCKLEPNTDFINKIDDIEGLKLFCRKIENTNDIILSSNMVIEYFQSFGNKLSNEIITNIITYLPTNVILYLINNLNLHIKLTQNVIDEIITNTFINMKIDIANKHYNSPNIIELNNQYDMNYNFMLCYDNLKYYKELFYNDNIFIGGMSLLNLCTKNPTNNKNPTVGAK